MLQILKKALNNKVNALFSVKQVSFFYTHVLGRGVVTSVTREKGEFHLVYRGEIVSADEGERREEEDGGSGSDFFTILKGKTFGENL